VLERETSGVGHQLSTREEDVSGLMRTAVEPESREEASDPSPSPSSEGAAPFYYMPAEWGPRRQTWMGWPTRADVWPNGGREAKEAVTALAGEIARGGEAVTVLASPGASAGEARAAFAGNGRVRVVEAVMDDVWLRDTGPIFLKQRGGEDRGAVAGVAWRFNGWGGKFPPWDKDTAVAAFILQAEGLRLVDRRRHVLEGGSVHVDGVGTLLATESCLLNGNRNPTLSKQQIERVLCETLGVAKIIWLPVGLLCDTDTDGHVDNFACFAREGVVLLAWCEDQCGDPQQHRVCAEAEAILLGETDAEGRPLEVVRVPLPPPLHYTREEAEAIEGGARTPGEQICASYINFCWNGDHRVIIPGFGAPDADRRAKAIFEKALPGREVIQLQIGRALALGGGNMHCMTCHQPSA